MSCLWFNYRIVKSTNQVSTLVWKYATNRTRQLFMKTIKPPRNHWLHLWFICFFRTCEHQKLVIVSEYLLNLGREKSYHRSQEERSDSHSNYTSNQRHLVEPSSQHIKRLTRTRPSPENINSPPNNQAGTFQQAGSSNNLVNSNKFSCMRQRSSLVVNSQEWFIFKQLFFLFFVGRITTNWPSRIEDSLVD